ncbi:MAG: DUF1573 domain-containing protein [Chitinophagales bacterium]
MKKIFSIALLLILFVGLFSCRKKGELPAEMKLDSELMKDTAQIEFLDSVTYHFDTIMQDDKVHHDFRIKNVSDKNLIIARAFGSCGCTVPDYPKDPIKPGATATIKVTFNSAGKEGEQHKNVTLVCNTKVRNEMLYLTGFVKKKD